MNGPAVSEQEVEEAAAEVQGPPERAAAAETAVDSNTGGRPSRSAWLASSWALPVFVIVLGAVFVFLSRRALWHTDLWGHLAYGRFIWETRTLPFTEPLMPLARGVEFIDMAWLSQVIGFWTIREFEVPGLQFVAAACVAMTAAALAWAGFRKTGSIAWTLIGLGAFAWLAWKQIFNGAELAVIIRPQMAGMVLFALMLAVVVGRPSRWHWVIVPVAFALWANLHGSFPVGILLLAVFGLGRGADVLRRTDKFGAIVRDWPFWRLVLFTELAAAAVLINPYGLRIFADAWLFMQNENLQDLVEWQALTIKMQQGKAAAAVTVILMILYRMTPRRITTSEVFALFLFGGLTLWTSRMIVWFAPIAAYFVTLHGAAIWRIYQSRVAKKEDKSVEPAVCRGEPRVAWTVAAIGTALSCVALTPLASRIASGPDENFNRAVSWQTPTGAARHLIENPPDGQLFNSYEYGDYLLWSNPQLPVFVAGHAHLVPSEVWEAYINTVRGGADWQRVLDRYGVQAIVLDRPRRQALIDRLMEEPAWRQTYQDANSAVFRRAGNRE